MRLALTVAALVAATAASADVPQTELGGLPQGLDRTPTLAANGSRVCRDRIEEVRAASGQPALDRQNAAPDQALLIAAVDKRIGGCSVMVMRNNLSDIRPLPAPQGPARLRPLR